MYSYLYPCHKPCPPRREDDAEVKVRLFDCCCRCDCDRPSRLPPAAPPVTIVNPCNCREKATVILSVDDCGNLVICVKRGC